MVPKYVFLFIGDGMSYPQIQATAYFNGAQQRGEESTIERVSFMDFPVIGSQYTYDSTSFCPDSASTATSIASGRKTASGVIDVSPDASEHFETIAEKLKRQLGYKVGVLTSVNLNHATPAAFYAHQQSRKNYCEIGQELIASGFDYFAGGGLLNRKSGVDFSTCAHSGLTVPVFALGAGAEVFDGFYDNTEIYAKLAALTGVA